MSLYSKPLVPLCGSYSRYFDLLEEREREAKVKEAKRIRLYPRERYVLDPPQIKSSESGEDRFKQFEWLLENGFSWKRHLFQKEFHAKAGMVLASQIIGQDWERIGTALIKERKWDMNRNSKMLLGRGPRRFGKSVSMAMLAAAYALTTPYSTQSIFSTSQRISVYLGELIYKAICDAGLKHRIKKFGEERMEIYGPEGSPPDDIRKVFYYPANAKIDINMWREKRNILDGIDFCSLTNFFVLNDRDQNDYHQVDGEKGEESVYVCVCRFRILKGLAETFLHKMVLASFCF